MQDGEFSEFASGRLLISESRALTSSAEADIIDEIRTLSPKALEFIKTLPSIFANENSMQWSGRMLNSVYDTATSSFVSLYAYDDAGLRTKKTQYGVGNISYTWDNGQLTSQTDGNTTLLFTYDASGNLVAMYYK